MDTDIDLQMPESPFVQDVEFDVKGQPVGISVETWFDKLDKKLIAHFGEDFRKEVNASRKRWNETGRWQFDKL
jgi:hypothetical protein